MNNGELLRKLDQVLKGTNYGRIYIPVQTPEKGVLFTAEKRVRIPKKDIDKIIDSINTNLQSNNLGSISIELRGADRPCDLVYECRYFADEKAEERRGSEKRF